jgi:hypothetical protein
MLLTIVALAGVLGYVLWLGRQPRSYALADAT